MNLSILAVTGVAALAAFAALASVYHLLRALQAREIVVAHAEDMGADPEVLSDSPRRKNLLVRLADRYDRSPAAAGDRERLHKAYLLWRPSTYRLILFGTSVAVAMIFMLGLALPLIPATILGVVVYFLGPRVFFASRQDAFLKAFDGQMDEVVQVLANGMRAGLSIQQAIGRVAERVDEPARSEFRQTHHELMLGDDLVKVLTALRNRVNSASLGLLIDAIAVQHKAGGNLVFIFNSMSESIAEQQRLNAEVRAMTAEGRFSALAIALTPLMVLPLLRDTFIGKPLFETPIGWGILLGYIVLQVVFVVAINRVASIKVS